MSFDETALALLGREHPAALLRAEIERVISSHGGLVLVTGEAGIGKTTLVTGAVGEARRRGALVVGGACWDSGSAPGYWPWVQVLRALRRGVEPQEWAAVAGGSLAALLGEAGAGETPDGFKIYDGVTTALVSLSQRRPLVIVIDDLHVADPASLRLLEFAAQQTWFERLLLIGTYRDAEVEPVEHPLRDLLSPLVAKATTITLTGLDQESVGALMARTVGLTPPADLVAEVHLRTGGNPFFVEQTARLWRSGGSASAVAPGVRDALLRRFSLLPAPVSELLPTAAVLGSTFHRQVLAATVAAPVAHVDRLLELAVAAKLVVARGGGVFGFAHDLVRETLYDSFDDVRDPHGAVIAAIDRSPELAGKLLPADLARHAYLAGDRVTPDRAIDLLLAAARDASGRLAADEQHGHLRRAFELSASAEPRRRATVALELSRELFYGGERDEGLRFAEEAAAISRDVDDPELPARVALTFRTFLGHDESLDRLREAHARLVGGGVPDDRLALDLVLHVAAVARAGGDDDALAFSLWTHHDIIWGPGTADERVRLTGEIMDIARRTSDSELEHFAAALRWVAMIEQGDPRYLDHFNDYVALGRRRDVPRFDLNTSADASIIAALAGRFGEAEELLAEIEPYDPGAHFVSMLHHHRWALLSLQGRQSEQAEVLDALRRSGHPCHTLIEALTAVRTGDLDTALRRLAAGDPHDRMVQPLWLRFQAELAAATHDPELCATARAALLPHRGQWAVSLLGWDVSGPFDLWLGMVEAAQERWADAIGALTAAYHSADQMHARPWSVIARAHLADALLARAGPGDAGAAAALLAAVEREAGELGMRDMAERARHARPRPAAGALPGAQRENPPSAAAGRGGAPAAGGRDGLASVVAPGGASAAQGRSSGDRSGGEFRRDGAVWTLAFAGRTAHMPDAKGLRDLHILLSRPGRDMPAVRLLAPEGGELVVAARRMGGDDVLDEEAKARYRRRLAALDEEIDRAAERGDDQRAAEFDHERAALLEELRAAAGLGGRGRRLGDEAERARKAVTARIRDVLRRLDGAHPELAAHLRATVSTGATCRYQPETEIPWRL
ncbi:ATP-binding protein [Nonomuraea sp. LPB2021202275-12-8]|uniref:ATP-binding protein n=1 Tax=Nonomuraea sp. LPB2021202275-12-8 TaxID=3120159 RepID=UPI00300D1918